MKFRPCIDLHEGQVKQIVGSTLKKGSPKELQTNFIAKYPADYFISMYKNDNLKGGHIIQLGNGNEDSAKKALALWPEGMQIGGGINIDNAAQWIERGAEAVIVTSHVFHDGVIDEKRLEKLCNLVGKKRLVLDLSCRKRGNDYYIVTNKWQTFTKEKITFSLLDRLSNYCFEYLVHAVDVEGKCLGIEENLVEFLGKWGKSPITYAGGIKSFEDVEKINVMGKGQIDFTIGSALDIFGGTAIKYRDIVLKYS